MLEVFALIFLSNVNRKNALERGRKPGGFVALTIILWLGLEFLAIGIGTAAELGLTTYGLAIAMAVIGGLISYLVAKNCKPGTYVPPAQAMAQAVTENVQSLSVPATLTIIRESSMVGALLTWEFSLNGHSVGALKNGQALPPVSTTQRKNVLTAKDSYGNEAKPFMFDVAEGAQAEIRFKGGFFLPGQSTGLETPSQMPYDSATLPQPALAQPVQAVPAQPVQAAFCHRCGTPLTAGSDACTACGAPRFVPPSTTGAQAFPAASVQGAQPFPATAAQGAYAFPASARPEAIPALEPDPKRAIRAAAWLFGAGVLIAVFHVIFSSRFSYCGAVMQVLCDALLGSGLYLLMQRESKFKIAGGITLFAGVLVFFLSIVTAAFLITGGGQSGNMPEILASLLPLTTIGGILLRALAVAGGGLFFHHLVSKRRVAAGTGKPQSEDTVVWRTSLYTALSVLGINLIYNLLILPPEGFVPVRLVSITISSLVMATTLFLSLPALQGLVHLKSKRLRLSGWGLVWCWIVTVSLSLTLISFIIQTALSTSALNLYSSQIFMVIAALIGFILLIAGRRWGWYMILFSVYIALAGQFQMSFNIVIQGNTQFVPLLSGSIIGALNPLITWFSIRSAWLASDAPHIVRPVAAPSAKPYKAFDKFVAIFNLAVGSVLLILPIVSLLDGEEFVTGMLVFIILALLMLGFSIPSLAVMKRRYPTWMRVVGIVIFSLAVLIVSALLITLIVESM
jgi:hypothetical protein